MVWSLIPEPNRAPDLPLSGAAPRAVASGSAYSFATGLLGSMWTGEYSVAHADVGDAASPAQTRVASKRAQARWRIGRLW